MSPLSLQPASDHSAARRVVSEQVTLTVHRGTRQIGGSCIEIAHASGQRLILDVGRPLDAPRDATGLLPESLDRSRPATVLISHPHQDHWGLIDELPVDWPVWTGLASSQLIALTSEISGRAAMRSLHTWAPRSGPLTFGPFLVTPILTDHSACDAYMLLIDCAGKRFLYTGDFRRHGRKSRLVDRLMANPPAGIDVLLTEGTNLGSDKPVVSESDLEEKFVGLFQRTDGRVFVEWSGQNIDRTVTLYRAARRSGRTLVIDLYTADVLDRISEGTKLPRAGFPGLQVVVTAGLARSYRRRGRESFVNKMARTGISAKRLECGRPVVMLRRGLVEDFKRSGVVPSSRDAFNYSMWRGYLKEAANAVAMDWCVEGGAGTTYIHTSGHASPSDLRAFARAVRPRCVVPVHGVRWDDESDGFGHVVRLDDAESLVLP